MVFYVAGINRVGKSTVLNSMCERDNNMVHVKGSALLMEALGIPPGDYHQLNDYDNETKQREFGRIITEYCDKYGDSEETYFIDAHLLNLIKGKVSDVTGSWMSGLSGIVLVEAPISDIYARIQSDTGRTRELFPTTEAGTELDRLLQYMTQTRERFIEVAATYELPSVLVMNHHGEIESAVNGIAEFRLAQLSR